MELLFIGLVLLISTPVFGDEARKPSITSTQKEADLLKAFPPLTFSRAFVKSLRGATSIPMSKEIEYPAVKGYVLSGVRGEIRFLFETNKLTRLEFWVDTESDYRRLYQLLAKTLDSPGKLTRNEKSSKSGNRETYEWTVIATKYYRLELDKREWKANGKMISDTEYGVSIAIVPAKT